ncbi:MAG TPA: SAM-dependent chlorinase/fluorinase [bacterium]|nr:SAM-dependent chlorinase/fluorinase [bacterium]HOL47017.1 SAM-dependent chlorinase/fluorinase [bacterium]HPQ18481.1 SAM-dependent chlorinase/fluorinase [bacterium]
MNNKAQIITLLTDFGNSDNYVAMMKAVILNINPDVRLIDITHNIQPQNILSAAYNLFTAYSYFPKNTIHLVVVDPGVGSNRLALLIKTKNYYFIGPDNGVLSLALQNEKIEKIINLTNKKFFNKNISNTFHGRDIFAPVAAYLSKKIKPENFGNKINNYKQLEQIKPEIINSNKIKGSVLHIDNFGNIITNINFTFFNKYLSNFDFLKIKKNKIKKLVRTYNDLKENEIGLLFGSSNFLEISTNKNNAAEILNCKIGERIFLINK